MTFFVYSDDGSLAPAMPEYRNTAQIHKCNEIGYRSMEITGNIFSGFGKGSFFTGIDWVVEQFEYQMGYKPFPGTLNIKVSSGNFLKLKAFFSKKDFELIPKDPKFCAASLKKVWVMGLSSAVVFPSEDVRIHPKAVFEIITSCSIKKTFNLADGDTIVVSDQEYG